jgi:hypothetical protein
MFLMFSTLLRQGRPERTAPHAAVFIICMICMLAPDTAAAPTGPEFHNTAPGVAYVGSQVCAGCHALLYEQYLKTGMGQSMSLAGTPTQVERVSAPVTIFQESTRRYFQVYQERQHLYQSQYELDGNGKEVFRSTHRLEYVTGSGANGQSYAIRRDDALFQAPLSYYSKPKKWALSPGFESSDVGFNRPILTGCVACHSGRVNPAPGRTGFYQEPAFAELAIGCENCHGPGQLHVAKRAQGSAMPNAGDQTIVNPARLPGWLADNICMNCHQTGDTRVLQPGKDHLDFRPGTPLNETVGIFRVPYRRESPPDEDLLEHYSSMVLSRCYRESNGRLSCITCHNPHAEPSPQLMPAYYRSKCLSCHTSQSCRVPSVERQRSGDDCSGCHMMKRAIPTIAHSALTNHRILARPGQPLPEAAFQQPTGPPDVIHVNVIPGREKQPVPLLTQLQVYGELLSQRPAYRERYLAVLEDLSKSASEHPLVLSSLARKARLEGTSAGNNRALDYLSRALERGSTSVLDYQDFAELLAQTGQTDRAITILKQGISLSPFQPVFYKMLALQYIHQKDYPKALETMERHLGLFPEDTFMRKLLRQAQAAPVPR